MDVNKESETNETFSSDNGDIAPTTYRKIMNTVAQEEDPTYSLDQSYFEKRLLLKTRNSILHSRNVFVRKSKRFREKRF